MESSPRLWATARFSVVCRYQSAGGQLRLRGVLMVGGSLWGADGDGATGEEQLVVD